MDVVLSFDTEDFLTPAAWDAQRWWAEELTARGIRGSFQVVGEVVRTLQTNGRSDVIDALARHEIGNHTDYHSVPPTHPQGVTGLSLAAGIEWVLVHEAACCATLESAFGRVPVTYCCPGDSWTPATLIAAAMRGAKVFCDSPSPGKSNRPFWYCGLLNTNYNQAIERCFVGGDLSVGDLIQRIDADLAGLTAAEVYTLYTHPTRLATTEFWDTRFFAAQRPPRASWSPAPCYAPADLARNQDRARRVLDHLQGKDGVRFVDYATVYAERSGQRRDLPTLLAECGLAPGQEGRLPARTPTANGVLPLAHFDGLSYGWGPLPAGFQGHDLIEQARGLAWTASWS